MKSRIQFVSGLVIAGLMAGMVMAEGDAPKKDAAPKAKSFKGSLTAKPVGAATNVIAVLTVKGKDAKGTAYNITSTDEAVVTTIKGLLARGIDVAIKGMLSEDGKSIEIVAPKVILPEVEKKEPKTDVVVPVVVAPEVATPAVVAPAAVTPAVAAPAPVAPAPVAPAAVAPAAVAPAAVAPDTIK